MTSHPISKLKFKTQDESRYGKIVHSGYLLKRSKGKSWNNRYAVLWEDLALRFYEQEDRGSVIGKIKLKYVDEVKEDTNDQTSIICITSTSQNKCSVNQFSDFFIFSSYYVNMQSMAIWV